MQILPWIKFIQIPFKQEKLHSDSSPNSIQTGEKSMEIYHQLFSPVSAYCMSQVQY